MYFDNNDGIVADGSVVCKPTHEGRINIPKNILSELKLVPKDNIYMNKKGNDIIIRSIPRGGTLDDHYLTVNQDGRVRISTGVLNSKFALVGNKFKLNIDQLGNMGSQAKIVLTKM